jgi:hypothetical protein
LQRQQLQRIRASPKVTNLEMEMGAGAVAGGADSAQQITLRYHLPFLYVNLVQMGVKRNVVDVVVDDYELAVPLVVPAGADHHPAIRGGDRCADGRGDVDGAVVGAVALAEPAVDRPDKARRCP